MEYVKNIIHYESTIIISLPCIQLAKLKSCSVCMGHLALPWSEALPPHTPLQEQKWQKSAIFGFLYFCPLTLTPQPPPPHPHPNKK